MSNVHKVSFEMNRGVLRRLFDNRQYLDDQEFRAEYNRAIRAGRRNIIKQQLWSFLLTPATILGLFAFTSWWNGKAIGEAEVVASLVLGVLCGSGLLWYFAQRNRIEQLMQAQGDALADGNASPGFFGPATVRADERGLHCSHHTATSCFYWPAVQFIREGCDIDGLWTSDGRVVGVPHEAHDSPEARTAFLDFVRAKNEEHGGTRAVMRRYLAEHSLKCPGCGYSLQGTDGTCPECGVVRPLSSPAFD